MPINGFFEKLMRSGQLNLDDGHIEELGVRMVFLPTYTLSALIEEMNSEVGEEKAFDMMFEAGKKHGKHIIDSVGKANEMPRNLFVDQFADSANALGLGVIKVERFEPEEGISVTQIKDSPFVEELKSSSELKDLDRPVDDLQRGIIHAICEEIFQGEVESKETHCELMGDDKCRIKVKVKE